MRTRALVLMSILVSLSLHAQSAMPRLTAEVLQQWLRSGDPRLIAWAAHYEGQYGDAAYPGTLAVMAEVLDRERTTQDPNALAPTASQHDHHEAEAAILDAFIQQRIPPSPAIVATIADAFPSQAILLASYLPFAARTPLLEDWYGLRNYDASGRLLGRISTLMLANAPPPVVAASIVNEAEEHLTILLRNTPSPEKEGFGAGACGDFLATPVRENWPAVFTYQLQENEPGTTDPVLVNVGKDRITYRRVADNAPEGSCFGVQPLTPSTRHQLIAYWLGIPVQSMSWSTQETSVLLWTTHEAYLADLANSVQQHTQALQHTVQALVAKKVLDEKEAATVQPRLLLSTYCEINPCPLGGITTHPPLNVLP